MQDIFFATLLFVVYFCFTCCFFYTPNSASGQITASSETDQPIPIDEAENLTQDLWVDEPITIAQEEGYSVSLTDEVQPILAQ